MKKILYKNLKLLKGHKENPWERPSKIPQQTLI